MWSDPAQPSKTSNQGGVLLVDGHAYVYRAYHAIKRLTGPVGQPTNAIFGFTKMVDKLKSWLAPQYMAVVWDGGMSPKRLSLLPEYKAQRPPMPDDLHTQISQIQNYLPDAGISSIQLDGVEADDCLATMAKTFLGCGISTVIASSDKDFMQLVRPGIGLVNPGDHAPKIWTDCDVYAKTGVRPEQIVDWLSLVGDTVDNIAGVPGIGPKTAAKLLMTFGSIEQVYQRIMEIEPQRLQEALKQFEKLVARNQELVRLYDQIGGDWDIRSLVVRPPKLDRLVLKFREWGFHSLELKASTGGESEQDLFTTNRA
jgi:DNA polymerase I